MTTLPVVSEPAPGESLRSYLARLAEDNLHQPNGIMKANPAQPVNLSRLAAMTGLPEARLRQLTWDGYPTHIIGRRGSTGWVLRKARWGCPHCLAATRVWQRAWELACLPVCLTCGRILVSNPAKEFETQHSDHLEWFRHINSRLTQAPQTKWINEWFGRLLRISRILAVTSDETWPQPTSPHLVNALNGWGHHPPNAPEALEHLIPFVAQLLSRRAEAPLIAEAWQRFDTMPATIAETLLPRRPKRRRKTSEPAAPLRWSVGTASRDLDRQRLKQLLAELAGYDASLVPALLPDHPRQFIPDEERWPIAQESALAAVMLMNPRRSTKPGWFTDAARHLHLPPMTPPSWLQRLEYDGAIDADKAGDIRRGLHQLSPNPTDYLQRRQALINLPRAPRFPRIGLDGAVIRGWLWVYLTHGRIVTTGPGWIPTHEPMPTRTVIEQHRRLTLEQRFLLAEFADRYWAELTGEGLAAWSTLKMAIRQGGIHAGS